MRNFVITAESVTVGHPDKICDQISDAIVDGYLSEGYRTGVAAECALASGVVFLSVRAERDPPMDLAALARRVLADAGYDDATLGGAPTVMVDMSLDPDTARQGAAVTRATHMVSAFGYACDQTPARMPLPIWAAHELSRGIDRARREGRLPWIAPDAQVQIALRYEDRRPAQVEAIALRHGTVERVDDATARAGLIAEVIDPFFLTAPIDLSAETRIVSHGAASPAGPMAHSGLTGRKSADDAYGSFIRRAGPALSGKDPSRIDRIANYAARLCARNIVAAGLAREAEVQLSYMIGDETPVGVEVDTYGSGQAGDAEISRRIPEIVDLRVAGIAEAMALWDLPAERGGRFYRGLAVYGQMGRDDLDAPWEREELADRFRG